MKKSEVRLGEIYAMKVSGRIANVRLTREAEKGWYGVNMATKREVRIRTAAKLRYAVLKNPRCHKCANCRAVFDQKPDWEAKARAYGRGTAEHTQLVAEWKKVCAGLPCLEGAAQ